MAKALVAKKATYTVEIGYSDDNLIRFIPVNGNSFEISVPEIMELVSQASEDTLAPTFTETDRINVVEVSRQLLCVLDEDMKKGQEIRLNYTHQLPIEFAIIEEVGKIAKINQDVPVMTLTKEYIEEVRKKLTSKQENFIKKFYKAFKQVKL